MKKNNLKVIPFILVLFLVGTASNADLRNSFISLLKTQFSKKTVKKDVYKNTKIDTARKVEYLNDLEKDVILELNKVRTNPSQYAKIQLTDFRSHYQGNIIKYPFTVGMITKEGVKAVDECINVLLNTKPMGSLSPSFGLSKAAEDMVKDQSSTNNTGHIGSDGSNPFDRMNRHGKWLFTAAENIDYGYNDAEQIVLALLVDDDVSSRGHRTNILNRDLNVIGVASGNHKLYRYMFMMDFAGGYKEKTK